MVDASCIVITSDTHFGDRTALCHPDGAKLDGGGFFKPSKLQIKIYKMWEYFWNEWVPRVTDGKPYDWVHNGDVIDGVHHNSTHQWSHNMQDQRMAAFKVMQPLVKRCNKFYMIRGTGAHDGESGVDAETLAQELGAVPDQYGECARWELWKRLGKEVIHFSHHIGTTASAQHETSAVNAELTALFTDAGRWERKPPLIIVRSHRHRCSEVRLPCNRGYATAFVTAGWQLKTPFSHKTAGGRVTTPQLGGSLIRMGSEEIYTRHFVHDCGRGSVE